MTPPLVRKISESGLAPRVAARRKGDVFLGGEDPSHDVASRRFRDWRVRILRHQPVHILVLELRLEQLVVAHVDGLHKASASGGDELHLDAERLDGGDDGAHHVDSEGVEVEEGDDSWGGRRDVWREDIAHPLEHDVLAEPSLRLAAINRSSRIRREFAAFDHPPPLRCRRRNNEHGGKNNGEYFCSH